MDLKTTDKRLSWLITHINDPLRQQRAVLDETQARLGALGMSEENAAQARKVGWATAKELRKVADALEEIAHQCEQL